LIKISNYELKGGRLGISFKKKIEKTNSTNFKKTVLGTPNGIDPQKQRRIHIGDIMVQNQTTCGRPRENKEGYAIYFLARALLNLVSLFFSDVVRVFKSKLKKIDRTKIDTHL